MSVLAEHTEAGPEGAVITPVLLPNPAHYWYWIKAPLLSVALAYKIGTRDAIGSRKKGAMILQNHHHGFES